MLRNDRMLAHNLIVGGGTIGAGVLGIGFQSLVSHQLRPTDYGAVFAVITLITFIGVPASSLSLLMARETSRDLASGHSASSAALLGRGSRALLRVGLAIAFLIALASPFMARAFGISTELLLVGAVGVPFGLALPLLLGEFQGEQRFVAFALLSIGQAGMKFLAAVVLGLFFGPAGIVAGLSLTTIMAYLTGRYLLRRKLSIKPRLPWLRPAADYLAVLLPSSFALSVLLSADVLLVKHYFPTSDSGQYSAVAALGRAIFWGAAGVATVLFPKAVFSLAQGRSGIHLVGASLLLVVVGGMLGLGLLWLTSNWLLTSFAGKAYGAAAVYLPWYAVGMTLLGGVAVLITTLQSQAKPRFLAILLPLSLLEPILIVGFHRSLGQVVQVVDLSMAGILLALLSLYVAQERAAERARIPFQANPTSEHQVVSVGSTYEY